MTSKPGDWSASLDALGQFFYILLALAIVILLFLIFARWFASLRYAGRGKNIRVIESCGVAPQSSVQILRAGGRVFLIGVTKDRVSMLADITDEIHDAGAAPGPGLFERYLKRYMTGAGGERKEDGI